MKIEHEHLLAMQLRDPYAKTWWIQNLDLMDSGKTPTQIRWLKNPSLRLLKNTNTKGGRIKKSLKIPKKIWK